MNMFRSEYKEAAIGLIPNGWDSRVLADCAAIIMGQSPAGDTYNSEGFGKPLLNGPTEFTDRYPVKIQWTTSPTKVCLPGDILICVRGSSTGRMNIANDEYCIGRGLASIRCKSGYSQDFLIHLLNHSVTKILKSAVGSTFPSIDGKAISSISVPTPPLHEQQKIAAILTAVDDKLDVISRQIKATQAFKQGLMQTLFSRGVGTQDATGHWTPHTEFKDSEVRDVPKLWPVKEIGEALSVVERPIKMADDQLYRRVTVRRRHGGVELRDELPGADIKVKNQFLLEAGDFLISERQIVHGACGIVPEHLAGALVSNEYLVLQAREGFDVTYFNYLVQLLKYAKLFLICSQGVDIEKFLFKPKDWLKKRIPVPPLAEQQRIAEILTTVEEKTNALQSKQSEYQSLKRGLMQKLLTGEWRVKLDSPSVTA